MSEDDEIMKFFMEAARIQAAVHTGEIPCRNCKDPIDDDHAEYCGMCREMGCA